MVRDKKGIQIVIASFLFAAAILPALAQGAAPKIDSGAGAVQPPARPIIPQRGPICAMRAFMPPPPEWLTYISKEVGLTPDQITKGREALTALNIKIQSIVGNNQAYTSLLDEMKSPTTDPSKVQKLAADAEAIESKVLQAELQTWIDYKKNLTPEQQSKFWMMMIRRPGAMPIPMPGTSTAGPNPPATTAAPPSAPTPPSPSTPPQK